MDKKIVKMLEDIKDIAISGAGCSHEDAMRGALESVAAEANKALEAIESTGNPHDMSAIIFCLVRHFGENPYDINNGRCDEFAAELLGYLGAEATEHVSEEFPEDLPGHYWIEFRGRHYDAETPYGVEGWRDLPVFKREFYARHYNDDWMA